MRIAYDPKSDNLDALTLRSNPKKELAKPATEANYENC